MTTEIYANRETILAPGIRTSFKGAFANLPYGGSARFEWSDDILKRESRPATVGDVLDNLARLQTVLEDVSVRVSASEAARLALDRDLAGAGRLLARLLPEARKVEGASLVARLLPEEGS